MLDSPLGKRPLADADQADEERCPTTGAFAQKAYYLVNQYDFACLAGMVRVMRQRDCLKFTWFSGCLPVSSFSQSLPWSDRKT